LGIPILSGLPREIRRVTHLYVLFAIELIRITGVQECDARDGEGYNAAKYIKILTGRKFTLFQLDNKTERSLERNENIIHKNHFYRAKYLL